MECIFVRFYDVADFITSCLSLQDQCWRSDNKFEWILVCIILEWVLVKEKVKQEDEAYEASW